MAIMLLGILGSIYVGLKIAEPTAKTDLDAEVEKIEKELKEAA